MTKAEKKFGLTVDEIRELKVWYVKQQDFETAVMWREMETAICPVKKKKRIQSGKEVYIQLLSENWYSSIKEKYGDAKKFIDIILRFVPPEQSTLINNK